MKLDIQSVPPSPNRILGKHWSVKAHVKDAWILLVRAAYVPTGRATPIRKRVTIWLYHSRPYDRDNAFASVKPVVDALKHWKIIHDDTSDWLDLDVQQEKCPHKLRHTEIYIEEKSCIPKFQAQPRKRFALK